MGIDVSPQQLAIVSGMAEAGRLETYRCLIGCAEAAGFRDDKQAKAFCAITLALGAASMIAAETGMYEIYRVLMMDAIEGSRGSPDGR